MPQHETINELEAVNNVQQVSKRLTLPNLENTVLEASIQPKTTMEFKLHFN